MKQIMPIQASQQFKELKELLEENKKKISTLEKKITMNQRNEWPEWKNQQKRPLTLP